MTTAIGICVFMCVGLYVTSDDVVVRIDLDVCGGDTNDSYYRT